MSNREHSTSYVYELSKKHGQVKYHQYTRDKYLGEGGFATCHKAIRNADAKIFAMKVIKIADKRELSNSRDKHKGSKNYPKVSSQEKANTEARLLKSCNHPNIVRYETDFIYENDFYLIMEYCQKGNFGQMLKKRGIISQVEARYYIRQMIQALKYLKQRKIIHRDLKPANYLLTDKLRLKIGDFGLATEVRNNIPSHRNTCGTPNYISPEMLDKKEYSYEVDLWSIGVILYSMLYGIPPFETKNKEARETYDKIRKCDYKLSDPKVSEQARDLISKILILNPKKRITLEGILYHPFMANYEIPPQLPLKCLKEEPDEKFLEPYQSQKLTKPTSKCLSQSSKKKAAVLQNAQLRNDLQKSFSLSSQSQYSSRLSKKDKKKVKMQEKKVKMQEKKKDKQNPKSNLKGIASILRKYQKDDMLTLSPPSQAESTDKHKGNQYPSQQKEIKPQFVKISSKQNQPIKAGYREIKQNYIPDSQIESQILLENIHEEMKMQPVVMQEFPSLGVLLKPLSFEVVLNDPTNQNVIDGTAYALISQRNRLERKNKIQQNKGPKLMKTQVSPPQQQKRNIKLQNEIKAPNHEHHQLPQSDKVYEVQDFLFFSPSIYQSSQKMMKLIYCLKQSHPCDQQSYKQSQEAGKSKRNQNFTKFIGIIFKDNSSIVIRIDRHQKKLTNNSIYVPNIQNAPDIDGKSHLLQILSSLELNQQSKAFNRNQKNIMIPLNENMLDQANQKDHAQNEQLKENEDNFNNADSYALFFQIKLKVRYAKDTVKYFQNLLYDNNQNYEKKKEEEKGKGKYGSKVKIEELSIQIQNLNKEIFPHASCPSFEKDFPLVTFFISKNYGKNIYFQLNDGSKHQMLNKNKKGRYQDLFKTKERIISKCEQFDFLIYFPNELTGYLKTGQQQLRKLKREELNTNLITGVKNQTSPKVKVCQDDQNQDLQSQISKRKKLAAKKSIKTKNQKALKKDLHLHDVDKPAQTSNLTRLLSQICNSMRLKSQLPYLRKHFSSVPTKQQKQMSDNKRNFCGLNKHWWEFKIEYGQLGFKIMEDEAKTDDRGVKQQVSKLLS